MSKLLPAAGRTCSKPTEVLFWPIANISQEAFGSASLVIRVRDLDQMIEIAGQLEGQLTTTVHAAPQDYDAAAALLPALKLLAGRVLFNGWPTGVEVGHAVTHGGPFPATSAPAR